MRLRFILLLPLLAGCRGDARRAAAEVADAGTGDNGGAFVIVGEHDTVARESYTRSPGHLSGRLVHADGTRVDWDAVVARDESIVRLELRLWQPRALPDSPPAERSVAELRGPALDTLVRSAQAGSGGVRVYRGSVSGGAQPYLLPSIALAQQLIRRARRLTPGGGTSVTLPIVALNGASLPQEVTVRWLPGDSVAVAVSGAEVRLALDGEGRIRDGQDAALGMKLRRVQ